MANVTVTVLEADGVTETDVVLLDVGRQAAAASKSVALATEDKAVLDNLTTLGGAVSSSRVATNPISGQAGVAAGAGSVAATVQRMTLASDDPAVAALTAGPTQASDTYTLLATGHIAGDSLSDSTSAPTVLTFTDVVRASGKGGRIEGVFISASAASLIQGELLLFHTTPTPINDDAAFALSDTDIANCIARIPFALTTSGTLNSSQDIFLSKPFLTVGSANLFGLTYVTAAITPTASEVLKVTLQIAPIG